MKFKKEEYVDLIIRYKCVWNKMATQYMNMYSYIHLATIDIKM